MWLCMPVVGVNQGQVITTNRASLGEGDRHQLGAVWPDRPPLFPCLRHALLTLRSRDSEMELRVGG